MQSDPMNGKGCVKFLMLGVFMFGALMMYPKTVDLMSNFAPDKMMGYKDLAGWYGMGAALLVEGVLVAMKIKTTLYPAANLMEWAWDAVLSFVPWLISGLCQIFDSLMVRDVLKDQPPEVQAVVTWIIPAIPAIILLMMLVYGLIESAPAGLFSSVGSKSVGSNSFGIKWPEKLNLRSMFDHKPSAGAAGKMKVKDQSEVRTVGNEPDPSAKSKDPTKRTA